jgi:hypothetical protein
MNQQPGGTKPPSLPVPALAPVLPPDDRWKYAPRWQRLQFLLTGCFLEFFLLAGIFASGVLWWARVLSWLGTAIVIVLCWRIMRLAIVATSWGLTIRNFRNTHRVAWADVEEIFRPGPVPLAVYRENPLAQQKLGLFIRLTEGAVISCTIYAPWLSSDRYGGNYALGRRADKAIDALNEMRTRYAPAPGRSSDVADSGPDLLS